MISSALSWRKWKKKCGAGEVPFRRAAGIPRCRRSVTGFAIRIIVFLPPSPRPPSRREGGGQRFFYARGFAPCIPGIRPPAALTEPAKQMPCERMPAARCKSDGNAFLWTVPAAKERWDRGRGTSAFEMVLSPGAGRASAARGKPHCPPPGTTVAGIASAARGQAPPCHPPDTTVAGIASAARGQAPLPPPGATAAGIASTA